MDSPLPAEIAAKNQANSDGVLRCSTTGWPVLIAACVSMPLLLFLGLNLCRLIFVLWEYCSDRENYYAVNSKRNRASYRPSWSAQIKMSLGEVLAPYALPGKCLHILEFLIGMTVLGVYFDEVSRRIPGTETCAPWGNRIDWQIEFGCNIALFIIYMIRLMGAVDKLDFMFTLYSLMNYCTIPPSFLAVILHRNWIGLRCMRAIHLLLIPHFLRFSGKFNNPNILRLTHLGSIVVTVILVGGGVFHLVESTGDIWRSEFTNQEKTYWEWVYMAVVTLSTVGYGDITPISTIGRTWSILFIIGAAAIFAAFLPELALIVSERNRYGGPFKAYRGTRHVLISGHITSSTMELVLRDFNRDDRRRRDLAIVFVHEEKPTPDMESIIEYCQSQVVYIQGSLLHLQTLQNARVSEADALLFVMDKSTADPEAADDAAIMMVASAKNVNPYLRCVVELFLSKSKKKIQTIPSFLTRRGDSVICFQEMELALAAQNCLAPGCATLLSNLIYVPQEQLQIPKADQNINDYLIGCQDEIYSGAFSPAFYGMNFFEAVSLCYARIGVTLLGTFTPQQDYSEPGLVLCCGYMTISPDCFGVFLAANAVDVRRVSLYCEICHADISGPSKCQPCSCNQGGKSKTRTSERSLRKNPYKDILAPLVSTGERVKVSRSTVMQLPENWEETVMKRISDDIRAAQVLKKWTKEPVDSDLDDEANIYLDVSGSFYWRTSRPFSSVVLTRAEALQRNFKNHVVVLITASGDDPLIGLEDFIIPQSSSRIPYNEINEIILLGDARYLAREWHSLQNLPKIAVLDGDPLNRADLRAVSVAEAKMCVILSAWNGRSRDSTLDDKAAVLAALNLKAMPFQRKVEIPTITAIQHDVNVRLLAELDPAEIQMKQMHLTEPFMCGETVTISALDSLLVTTYYTPLAVTIIEDLLYGFQSPLLQSFLAEGIGLIGGGPYSPEAVSRYNTRIRLIPVTDGPWLSASKDLQILNYGELFQAAASCSLICMGISRRFCRTKGDQDCAKRIVINSPPASFAILADDKVFVLSQ